MLKFLLLTLLLAMPSWATPLTVVELFTSQGCSSCPGAEAYIGSLQKKRDDILVLSFHVDYWDRLGWQDPYADPEYTQRQYDYSNYLSGRPGRVYTPQIVIDGTRVAGSPYQITTPIQLGLVDQSHKIAPTITPTTEGLTITVPAGSAPLNPTIWLVGYDTSHTNEVKRGKNSGKKLTSTHTVQHLRELGTWDGNVWSYHLTTDQFPSTDALAILVQEAGPQQILGAATYNLR